MDSWCAMWFWPLEAADGITPPTTAEWLSALEGLLGIDPADTRDTEPAQIDLFADLDALEAREAELAAGLLMPSVTQVGEQHPWLAFVREVADREGFFHWELQFAPVFRRGGFDLQIGNPPWVRPEWSRQTALTEYEPLITFDDARESRLVRSATALDTHSGAVVDEASQATAQKALLNSEVLRPQLRGIQPNLYMLFIIDADRRRCLRGVLGLVHPVGHLTEARGGPLRSYIYPRLARLWHFVNELLIFPDIGHTKEFAIGIYRYPGAIDYKVIAKLVTIDTVDGSLSHDGSGSPPGIKDVHGRWSTTPHADRVIEVDFTRLRGWGPLSGGAHLLPEEVPSLWPFLGREEVAIEKLTGDSLPRLHSLGAVFSEGWRQAEALLGDHVETGHASEFSSVVLQGPAFDLANPFATEAKPAGGGSHDYTEVQLEEVAADFVPRSNFRVPARSPRNGIEDRWRVLWRCMIDVDAERPLKPVLVPPGVRHFDLCGSLAAPTNALTVHVAAWMSALPMDYATKVLAKGHLRQALLGRLPYLSTAFAQALTLRVLRLNCITAAYAPIWVELFRAEWFRESWALEDARLGQLAPMSAEWTLATPLRRTLMRRVALVEVDALVALAVGWTADDLCFAYRTQFYVARKNDLAQRFDQAGRCVPRSVWTALEEDSQGADLGRYVPPFTKPDREAEMRQAYAVFAERYGGGVA
jgi:hypothetical protein